MATIVKVNSSQIEFCFLYLIVVDSRWPSYWTWSTSCIPDQLSSHYFIMLCYRTKSTKFAVTLRVHNSQTKLLSGHSIRLPSKFLFLICYNYYNACQNTTTVCKWFWIWKPWTKKTVEFFNMNCCKYNQTVRFEIVFVRRISKCVTSYIDQRSYSTNPIIFIVMHA